MGETTDIERSNDKAIQGAQWAALAVPELNAAVRHLAGVGVEVAREIRDDGPRRASFLVASQAVEDAWNACTKALKVISRAREALVDAREEPSQ